MIQSVVIAAAGRGTRMQELTLDRPKHLLEVHGKPFIAYVLDHLLAAGFEKLFLVVGYHKERFDGFLRSHDYPLTIIDQHEKAGDAYGTAIPIRCVRDYVPNESFVSVAGDNLYGVEDLKRLHALDDAYTFVGGLRVPDPAGMGVLLVDKEGFLERIVEKPKTFMSNLVNTSLYKFTPEIFEAVDRVGLSARGEYEITDALTALASERKVKVVELKQKWADFGRPEDIKRMEELIQPR